MITTHSMPDSRLRNTSSMTPVGLHSEAKIRIGAVSYLNSKPLIFGLEESIKEKGSLCVEVPSQLAKLLHRAEIDIGLIPVVEFFSNPKYRIVSNAAIACRGPVWSVRLFFRCAPSRVRLIAMDEGSRTSIALVKVLFFERYGYVPRTTVLPLDLNPLDADADAVLVIGDRAMHPDEFRPAFQTDWDLGQEWFDSTGLPFVFAMWVARDAKFETPQIATLLETTRDQGVSAIDEIADKESMRYRLSHGQCQDYLKNYIRFTLGTAERAGLDEFRRKCQALNLISFATS